MLTAVSRIFASKIWVRPILVRRAVRRSAGMRRARPLLEDVGRNGFDLGADPFEFVSHTVDDGIEEVVKRGQIVLDERLVPPGMLGERAGSASA